MGNQKSVWLFKDFFYCGTFRLHNHMDFGKILLKISKIFLGKYLSNDSDSQEAVVMGAVCREGECIVYRQPHESRVFSL